MKEFREINEALDRCCQLALRQPLPDKQLVLMTDASFQAAGYAVLIEDDPNQKYTSTRKTYAPIAYGSKTYSPSQIKMSIYAKGFLAIYMAFKGQEDFMQIDFLPELPPSGGYENIITAIDVFSRYAFAYPVSNPTAVNTAKVIIDIMTRHAYLPTLNITDKRSVFFSQVIHEVAEILGINLKHATTKHAQTIGVLERAHATIKTSLKMASGEYRKQWHKYLPIAILNYNTTYHSSIDCEPSRVFHGRVPHNFLDHKLGLRFNPNIAPTTDFAEELLQRTKILYDKT